MTLDNINSIVYGYIVGEETHDSGSMIMEEGKRGDWVYVILEGKVRIKKRTPKGFVTIETLGPGGIIGEMVLLKEAGLLRTASIIADGAVKLGVLDRERLAIEYESLSLQLRTLIKTMVLKLEDVTRKASKMALE